MEAWVGFEACPQVTADHLAFPLPDVSLPSSSLLGAVIPLGILTSVLEKVYYFFHVYI